MSVTPLFVLFHSFFPKNFLTLCVSYPFLIFQFRCMTKFTTSRENPFKSSQKNAERPNTEEKASQKDDLSTISNGSRMFEYSLASSKCHFCENRGSMCIRCQRDRAIYRPPTISPPCNQCILASCSPRTADRHANNLYSGKV